MPDAAHNFKGLTGNQLKLIAMIAMTCDHVGVQLLPQMQLLRIIGRIAFPIYAYMIAEGCRHTRNRGKYLLRVALLAALCQVVYYAAMGSMYMSILVTFSLSIGMICLIENVQQKRTTAAAVLAFAGFAGTVFVCVALPYLLKGTDFGVDYGLLGVLLPVMIYFGRPHEKYLMVGLLLMCLLNGGIQWASLAAIPLLAIYNGQRGKGSVGKLFYIYYPLHLVVIHGISLLL